MSSDLHKKYLSISESIPLDIKYYALFTKDKMLLDQLVRITAAHLLSNSATQWYMT